MQKKLGFGIIGCGIIADFHANAIHECFGDADLIGVCDVVYDAAEKFATRHRTKAFKDEAELLSCKDVDVVCICTPSGYHHTSVIAAARAGKHIICEKPLAINKEQLDACEAECKKAGITVSVISQNRYAKSVNRAKNAIDEGLLGKIVCADIYMKYYRSQEYYDSGSWRGTKRIDGGGALMNQGIHGVDLLLYLAGPIKSVYALSKTLVRNIEVEDTLSAVVEYESGATGIIQATTSVYPGYPRRLDINGEKGSIVLDETSIVRWDIQNGGGHDDVVLMPSFASGASTPTAISNDGHIRQISDTIRCIRNGIEPLSGLADGRRAVDVILAIYRSAEEKRPIYL
ncbi:MAG: Gfo/Idh/MocA family oxidoreductase [Clostridia bacterium]|nr:Gfo/Idh/MocA family oxidoreductase [Clostridia bacterium]